jgi:hypothetical protein
VTDVNKIIEFIINSNETEIVQKIKQQYQYDTYKIIEIADSLRQSRTDYGMKVERVLEKLREEYDCEIL